MGSGSSKKNRQSSNSILKSQVADKNNANKSPLANTRSVSYPSYLASLQKQPVSVENNVSRICSITVAYFHLSQSTPLDNS